MRLVIQRVTRASVTVDREVVGKIKKGFLVFVGIGASDDEAIADKYLKKMLGLRIFEDKSFFEGRRWRNPSGIAVYTLRKLPSWKPAQLYRSRPPC